MRSTAVRFFRTIVVVMVELLFFLGLAGQSWADDWPMLGHDAARSGATSNEIRPPFARKWYRLFSEEGIQSGVQPVICQGKVYLGTLAGKLHAIDAETGKDIWCHAADGPILHAAATDGSRVFFGCADGQVYAVDCGTGRLAWKAATGAAVWNAPVIFEGMLFIGSRDGFLYAFDTTNGTPKWKADFGSPILNSSAVDPKSGRIYVGSESMEVHGLSLADGKRIWKSPKLPGVSLRGYHPVIAPDGSVLVTTAPVIGYDKAATIAKEAYRSGRTVREVAREMSGIPEDRLNELLDPRSQTGNT